MLKWPNETLGRLIFRGGGVQSSSTCEFTYVINVKVLLLRRIQDRGTAHPHPVWNNFFLFFTAYRLYNLMVVNIFNNVYNMYLISFTLTTKNIGHVLRGNNTIPRPQDFWNLRKISFVLKSHRIFFLFFLDI